MTTNHPISTRLLSLFTIIILLFGLVGCNSNDGSNKKPDVNKAIDYAKNYLQEDLVGNLIGVELEYGKAVKETINSNEYKVGFYVTEHNTLIKKDKEPKYVELYVTSEKILLGYNIKSLYEYMVEAYDYSMKYTTVIYWDGTYEDIESSETTKPNNSDNTDNTTIQNTDEYNWAKLDGALYMLDSENESRALNIGAVKNDDGTINLEFWCCTEITWRIFSIDSSAYEKIEKDGDTLYSFVGEIYDVYENGQVIASGIEPNDKVTIVFNANKNEFTVTSLLELMDGSSPYPIMCSGMYVAVE